MALGDSHKDMGKIIKGCNHCLFIHLVLFLHLVLELQSCQCHQQEEDQAGLLLDFFRVVVVYTPYCNASATVDDDTVTGGTGEGATVVINATSQQTRR